jgi:hypothetical protein
VRSVDDVLGRYRLHGSNNFAFVTVDESYFRDQIRRQELHHGHARQVAERLGLSLPSDVRAPRDAAFLAFRLASLLLDPGHPAYAGDTRRRLARQGVVAALTNPQFTWPNRLRRAAWFAACGLAPASYAPRLVDHAPDTPARRAKRLATRRS